MKELWKLVDVLEEDIKVLAELLLNNQRNPALERAYIKCVFSTLDGILFTFRQEMINSKNFDKHFTVKERASLLEKEYEKKSNTVSCRDKYLPLKESIKFTLKCFARHRAVNNYQFPASGGWEYMREAIDIRHRITHPKDLDDFNISRSDLEMVIGAKKWFKDDVMRQFV